jgi:hypothetical protein
VNRVEHLLTILGEECVEVAQRCSKALRFGVDEAEPGQKYTNADRIMRELADVRGVVEMLGEDGVVWMNESEPAVYRVLVDAKKAKIERYLVYSAQCGTLHHGQACPGCGEPCSLCPEQIDKNGDCTHGLCELCPDAKRATP